MLWIGLTGGIASGKSTFCSLLEQKKVSVIYADRLSHEAIDQKSPIFPNLIEFFGKSILNFKGDIDRKKLGEIVFSDREKMNWLEEQIHPLVKKKVSERKKSLENSDVAFGLYEVPLLFEKKMEAHFDKIVVVVAKREVQLQRLQENRGFTKEEAEKRIASQMSNSQKIDGADYVIENDGDLKNLEKLATQFLSDVKEWV